MKMIAILVAMLASSTVFAQSDVPCSSEATLKAFETVLDEKKLTLSEMDGFGIQEAGTSVVSKGSEYVVVAVNLGLTENGLNRSVQVAVTLEETFDNVCRVMTSEILDNQTALDHE